MGALSRPGNTNSPLSSDLLHVAAWVAVGLCLGSGFAVVVARFMPPRLPRRNLRSCRVCGAALPGNLSPISQERPRTGHDDAVARHLHRHPAARRPRHYRHPILHGDQG